MPGNRSENRKMTQRKRDRSICSLNRSPLVGNSAHSCWASFGKLCQMCLIIVHTRDGSGEHSPPAPYPKLSRLPLGCCFLCCQVAQGWMPGGFCSWYVLWQHRSAGTESKRCGVQEKWAPLYKVDPGSNGWRKGGLRGYEVRHRKCSVRHLTGEVEKNLCGGNRDREHEWTHGK